jgi:glucose/arabinose dehydrogenase
MNFDTPKTKTLKRFIEKEGPQGSGRVVGVTIEPDGVFIYTDSSKWCDDSGAGTFREDSETLAVTEFYANVRKAK